MSDDISVAPLEVQAALESDRHQQIVLFIHISVNGHGEEEEEDGGGGWVGELAEDDGERPLSCCVSSLSRVLFY